MRKKWFLNAMKSNVTWLEFMVKLSTRPARTQRRFMTAAISAAISGRNSWSAPEASMFALDRLEYGWGAFNRMARNGQWKDMHSFLTYYFQIVDRSPSTYHIRQLMAIVESKLNIDEDFLQEHGFDSVEEYLGSSFAIVNCDDCGGYEMQASLVAINSHRGVCQVCIDQSYRWSSYHDEYILAEDANEAIDRYGERIWILDETDDFEWNDELELFVHVDYAPPRPQIIGGYHSSKRKFVVQRDEWSRRHNRYFGVELEVEVDSSGETREDVAERLHNSLNDDGQKVFFEHDGSLNHGFEIISQPMSLPAHRNLWSWLQDREMTKGLKSHKTTTCGLHVHVNKDNMTHLQKAKMVAFVNMEENKDFITALARRYASGYCKIKLEKSSPGKALENPDRYEAINLTNYSTIEFRIFKGTLKYESLVSAIEFVNAIVEYTAISNMSVKNLHWTQFMNWCSDNMKKETAVFRKYLNSRFEDATTE